MVVRELGQVWALWGGWPHAAKGVKPFTASLGDGSKIDAVGRPRGGICEVHSERGIEYRHAWEQVLCEDYEPEGENKC